MSDDKTSEQIHGICNQPPPTCPMIDAAINKLRDGESCIKRYDRCEDPSELKDMIDRLETELFHWDTVEKDLEEIRENVERIRAWGQEWKNLCLATIAEKAKVFSS